MIKRGDPLVWQQKSRDPLSASEQQTARYIDAEDEADDVLARIANELCNEPA
ncbi:MAG: hypothetical protein ABI478_14435 [Propionivibrio sp.]